MAEACSFVTEVSGQEQGRVLVSIPMVGFPPGFELRSGDRVVLVHDEQGTVVRPLVRSMTVHEQLNEAGGQLVAGEQMLALQPASVRGDTGFGPPYTVWVTDRADDQGHVVAFRSERQ
jgi:hypothetical protein